MRIQMTYFPMFVSIEGKPCLIVGGGAVAARKCRGLLAFGANVTMIAERFLYDNSLHHTEADRELMDASLHNICSTSDTPSGECCRSRCLRKIERRFQDGDLAAADWTLVVAATDDRTVNGRIAALCRERQIPVNVADCKEECTFFFPAYCREGEVAVGVTTSGTAPGLASALRARIEAALPDWLLEIRKETDENA